LAVEITMKELLEAGVHFGHQTRRWNPKMKEYIFGERNGIHIVDLQKTLKMFREAAKYVSEMAALGKTVLFVGTKRQAQEAVAEEAQRCKMFYVNHRWLGGTLTNWATLQKSIKRLKELTAMSEDGRMALLSKKEGARLEREKKHLYHNLAGVESMGTLPDLMFVIDSNAEEIAVREARRMGVPVVAIVDTNSDPDVVDWVIPGNDDALRAIRLFASKISDAVLEGRSVLERSQIAEAKAAEGVPVGEENAPYVDNSAYDKYEPAEGNRDFVEGAEVLPEPVVDLVNEPAAEPVAEETVPSSEPEAEH
jgi:small subunit ribosomal protein S2